MLGNCVMKVFLLLCFFVLHSLGNHEICDGAWTNWSNEIPTESLGDAGLGWSQYNDVSLMCPADTFYLNLFHHRVFDRARSVLKRSWVAHNSLQCLNFSPFRFLSMMRDRKLYLIGDSTTMQIFQSFVCSLYSVTKSELKFQWHEHRDGKAYNEKTCPLKALHCHLWASSIVFPELEFEIIYRDIYGYESNSLSKILQDAGPRDLVIMNFGLHFNQEMIFESSLESFAKDLKTFLDVKRHDAPKIQFRESLPSHFDTKPSGYYNAEGQNGKRCTPLTGTYDEIFTHDWRNNLLEKHLNSTGIQIMRITRALYSQYDAHIDGDSEIVHFDSADCVHYGGQSGVMSYLKMIHFNYIWHALSHHHGSFNSSVVL